MEKNALFLTFVNLIMSLLLENIILVNSYSYFLVLLYMLFSSILFFFFYFFLEGSEFSVKYLSKINES